MDKINIKVIREIINRNYNFGDLNGKYIGMDSTTGNIFCPFHDNFHTPSAKFYEDESTGRQILHCFTEHRRYTPFDYVNLIICQKWGKYETPLDFLKKQMDSLDLEGEIKLVSKMNLEYDADAFRNKIDFINNVYYESADMAEYIERIYNYDYRK